MKPVYAVFVPLLLMAGCAAAPQLEPRPGGNPMQVDLSGQWILRGGEGPAVTKEQTIRMPPSSSRRTQSGMRPDRGKPRSKDSSVHVFLESGSNLKVTQTDYGLFFSFDRAIVEEYNFGENRLVNVGPIEAQRVSGWDGRSFVVETMDAEGNVLTETWSLDEKGRVLVRDLVITEDDQPGWWSRQVFDRE
jgi:hypothetical protein